MNGIIDSRIFQNKDLPLISVRSGCNFKYNPLKLFDMTQRQLSIYKMLRVLRMFFDRYIDTIQPIPHFTEISVALDTLVVGIDAASVKQISNQHGAGANKRLLKANLVRQCVHVAVKLTAYAALSNDEPLRYKIKTTPTELGRMREEELTAFGGILHDQGIQYLDRAFAYGLTPQNLSDLKEALRAFEEAVTEPRMARIAWKVATGNMADLFREVDEQLEKADLLMSILQFNEPEVYAAYKVARMLVDHAGPGLQMVVTVTDKESGLPLPGALCRLVQSDQPDHPVLAKKSAARGGIFVKTLEGGNYRLSVALAGYQVDNREVVVTKGKFLRVGVELEKLNDGRMTETEGLRD